MRQLLAVLLLVVGSSSGFAALVEPAVKPATDDVVSATVGAPEESPRSGTSLETKTVAVASRLRCPVCQGLSIADSPASMAVNMKREVRDLLSRGFSERQILEYFEHSYGQFVLLDPPRRGINWLVWLLPLLLLAGGVFMVRHTLAAQRGGAVVVADVDDEELATYIERVREIAYGDRQG
jgi:cytochrome c-type biogenesis protein CcmH/NrfF